MESFEAHWGVPGGIVQTIVGSQLRGKGLPCPPRIRHELHLGEQSRAVLYEIKRRDETMPIILLAHGMGGCSESGYIKRISTKLWMRGYGVFLINHLGCGPGMGLSPRLWNGGSSDDLAKMIDFVIQKYPGAILMPIGFSLSGNVLLKYLGEGRKISENISGALAVNPPVDLRVASAIISNKWSCALFNRYYMRLIRNQAVALAQQFPSAMSPLKNLKTIWDFDVSYTAPAGGFKDVDDYYDRSSSQHYLKGINIPTAILSAEDDPFVPGHLFDQAVMSEKVTLHQPKKGGHMGYISRHATSHGDRRWMDYAVLQWIQESHEAES
ncbi:MAG: alpha/beta fold hydrolase [Nitrospinae bacterium]|nr:alpha/beta fold hydrolase [Nitrospinota bacterium]